FALGRDVVFIIVPFLPGCAAGADDPDPPLRSFGETAQQEPLCPGMAYNDLALLLGRVILVRKNPCQGIAEHRACLGEGMRCFSRFAWSLSGFHSNTRSIASPCRIADVSTPHASALSYPSPGVRSRIRRD